MWLFDNCAVPRIKTPLPGPRAAAFLQRDERYMSPSYTRIYPLVVERGSGAVIEDVDGNLFLDFTAGIAVVATGHCHPAVVAAIQEQAAKLVHRRGFSPLVPDIHHVPYPRGPEARTTPNYGKLCVKHIEDTLLKRVVPPEEVAAVFVEPIQGEGGYHVPPPDFLAALRAMC